MTTLEALVLEEPDPTFGYEIQRPAADGAWRWVVELADTSAGDYVEWFDITTYYVGDRHQFGADTYKGTTRARLVTVQLQIDDSDMLAPWGQDTSSIFGVDVQLDAGLLMRASMARVVSGVVEEWEPIWTGRVEAWDDESAARGQIRRHVVSVVDTISDLANVPTTVPTEAPTWGEFFTDILLPGAGWLFGVDVYGDTDSTSGYPVDLDLVAAISRMDADTLPLGLVWRSLRSGRLVIHPAPWDTTNVDRYPNPLLDVYPDGLRFSYSPDLTEIEYITDDDQRPFGIQRTVAGVLNYFVITMPTSGVYAIDDATSIGRYGIRPYTASWAAEAPLVADDLLADRKYASAQALPLRTTLDHEGFWSALAIVDHLDPVTVVHATSDEGLVVTGTGLIRNIVEERTFRGEAGGDYALSWQSTVQIDLNATETAEALLPVEDLVFVSSESLANAGPSSASFTWTNPTQPSITPTEVQVRVPSRSLIWSSEDYPGDGADGTTVNWLEPGTFYTFQVRLVRRVNGVIVNASAIREVDFFTPNRIFPIPVPDGTDTDVEAIPPEDECDDFEVELQENDGTGWVTVDTFTGSEFTDNGDGTFSLTYPIPNSFFNEGSMYRFRSSCDGVDWIAGTSFDPPDDWADPCTTPPALADPPFDDADLLVYVPKICAPDTITEAVSGLAGVHGDALQAIVSGVGDPTERALLALADPLWSDSPGGILAYGECPQITGHTGDKTLLAKVDIAQAEFVTLGEVAGVKLGVTPSGTGWKVRAYVAAIGGEESCLSDELTLGTYHIALTYEFAIGELKVYVEAIEQNAVDFGEARATINAPPAWRVGAPPESWITDFALFDRLLAPSEMPGYLAPPTVTINKAAGQADPVTGGNVLFTVVFSEAVSGFATGDVTLSGTAGATTAVVSGSGPTYTVTVSGMTTSGTVVADIAASVCTSVATGQPNDASTSTDNSVVWNVALPTTNLIWRWDPSVTASISHTAGVVNSIAELVGSGDSLDSSGTNRPSTGVDTQNGLNVLTFAADYLERSGGATIHDSSIWANRAVTVIMVVEERVNAGLFSAATSGSQDHQGFQITRESGPGLYVQYGKGSAYASNADLDQVNITKSANSSGVMGLLVLRISPATGVTVRYNGSDLTVTDAGTFTMTASQWLQATNTGFVHLGLGRRQNGPGNILPFTGKMGEVLVYSAYLTGANLTNAEAAQTAKWGL